jgi:hypothetical protein
VSERDHVHDVMKGLLTLKPKPNIDGYFLLSLYHRLSSGVPGACSEVCHATYTRYSQRNARWGTLGWWTSWVGDEAPPRILSIFYLDFCGWCKGV